MAKKIKQDEEAYIEVDATTAPEVEGTMFTYVGGGEDSPRVINFMGVQEFVRGKAVKVTNPEVLKKIRNNPTFYEGVVEEEELHEHDVEAKKEADKQRKQDKRTQHEAEKLGAKNAWADKD